MKSYKYPNGIFFAMLSLVFLFFFFVKKATHFLRRYEFVLGPFSILFRLCVKSIICNISQIKIKPFDLMWPIGMVDAHKNGRKHISMFENHIGCRPEFKTLYYNNWNNAPSRCRWSGRWVGFCIEMCVFFGYDELVVVLYLNIKWFVVYVCDWITSS